MSSIRMFPASQTKEKFEEDLREKLTKDLEAAKADIEHRIAELKRTNHEGELTDAINELDGQLTTLEASLSQASTASLSSLMMMNATMHSKVGATMQAAATTTSRAAFESANHHTELTIDKMVAMDVKQLQQLQFYHDTQSTAFRAYETHSNNRIEQLAAAKGVDISGYTDLRSDILTKREEAKRDGDRLGTFKQEALLAHANLQAGIMVGKSPDEIARDAEENTKARERYLKEAEIEAINASRARGESPDEQVKAAQTARKTLASDLDRENAANDEKMGVAPAEAQNIQAATNTQAAVEMEKYNARTDEHSTDNQFAVKAVHGETAITSNRDMWANALPNRNSEITLTGSALATTSHNNSSTLALSLSPENPIALAMAGAEQAKEIAKAIPDTKAESDPEKHENVEQPTVPNKVAQAKGQAAASTPS